MHQYLSTVRMCVIENVVRLGLLITGKAENVLFEVDRLAELGIKFSLKARHFHGNASKKCLILLHLKEDRWTVRLFTSTSGTQLRHARVNARWPSSNDIRHSSSNLCDTSTLHRPCSLRHDPSPSDPTLLSVPFGTVRTHESPYTSSSPLHQFPSLPVSYFCNGCQFIQQLTLLFSSAISSSSISVADALSNMVYVSPTAYLRKGE